MNIRAAMVEYALAQSGVEVNLVGDPDSKVERVSVYSPGSYEPGVLYVADSSVELAIQSEEKPKGGKGKAKGSKNKSKKAGKSKGKVIASDAGFAVVQWKQVASPIELVEAAYQALRRLDAWDADLKDALIRGTTLDEFMGLGRDMLSCPLAYFDRNLIVLAASNDYWSETDPMNNAADDAHVEGQMPIDRAVDLVEDDDYLNAAKIEGGFYYEDTRNRMYYGVNTFDGGEYLARLVLALPEGKKHLHRGEEQLVDVFHAGLENLHARYAGHAGVATSQNDSLHVLVRQSLLEDAPLVLDEADSILASYGWSCDDEYLVAKVVFFEGVHWDTVSLYLCGLFERAMSASCAFPAEQQIVWFANLSKSAASGETTKDVEQRFVNALIEMLRNYACKAGISDVFAQFGAMRGYYLEAEQALALGQVRDPHYWYYRFSDYALDYLLARCSDGISPDQICHPALARLIAHDRDNATEYARTLVCFLRNSQNTTHAANELFIHRTSFMRRMSQIESLVDIDLGDADQVLYLLLSAKLLGM